jgi:hypothetical protein
MELTRFKVTNFRSVEDSGWIDVDRVAALIGTNESGKTNLLLPLWKLNPAGGGEIRPTADYPRKLYNQLREANPKPVFIEAMFRAPEGLVSTLVKLTGAPAEQVQTISVARSYDGKYRVGFPDAAPKRTMPSARLNDLLVSAAKEIEDAPSTKTEEVLKTSMLNALSEGRRVLDAEEVFDHPEVASGMLKSLQEALQTVDPEQATRRSSIGPAYGRLLDTVASMISEISVIHPQDNSEARSAVVQALPKFVYYSNYGNLDSEIYLPHVIDNLKRDDLGAKEEAKARTLRVLFEFVSLSPEEILELGRDFRPPPSQPHRQPTDEEIATIAEAKKERSILMQSASSSLTEKFRRWWRQGEYRFRLEADGDHFRIWVSDDRRPEEIELEGRSTGLQWFLSFYLVFLVESQEAHQGAILLLDEPGLSLHPLAQKDLSDFFEGLSPGNQLMYTTHSPFLVDADRLERVKAVYVDENGKTAVSSDLRAVERKSAQGRSIYPVYAALGLSVSDTILNGARPVLVEGPSDQFYLTGFKTLLIAGGRIRPTLELIFIPTGGTKGVRVTAGILTGKDDEPPIVLLDSDTPGARLAGQLRSELYKGHEDRILQVATFTGIERSEIEDLVPFEIIVSVVSRQYRGEDDFEDIARPGEPIIPQIEAYAAASGIELEDGWKVELARAVKTRLLQRGAANVSDDVMAKWTTLFEQIG